MPVVFSYLSLQAASAPPEPSLSGSFQSYVWNENELSTTTFTSVPFGDASSDRYIAIVIGLSNNTTNINNITIGGVGATVIQNTEDGNTRAIVAIAAVPTGTSGDIVVTVGTTSAVMCGVWSLTGLTSSSSYVVGGVGGTEGTPSQITLNAPTSSGFAIMGCFSASGLNTPTTEASVSNLTKRFDAVTAGQSIYNGAGGDAIISASGNITLSVTLNDSGVNTNTPAAAALFY